MFKNCFRKLNLQFLLPISYISSIFIYKRLYQDNLTRQKMKCEVVEEIDDEYYVADIKKFMKKYYLSPDSKRHSFILFTGNGNKELAQEVAKDLKASLGKVSMMKLDNGESFIKVHETVSNRNIIIIQSLSPPINDNLMELLFLISALKRESAKKIIVVIPYFSYSRKLVSGIGKVAPRPASVIVRLLEGLGVDQVIAIELHSKPITGFSKSMPIIDLDMVYVGASYLIEKMAKGEIAFNPVIVSPDVNGAVRARKMRDILELNGIPATLGFISDYKGSDGIIKSDSSSVYIGDNVKNKDIIIVDDMIHTGTKLTNTVKLLRQMECGEIFAFITHNLLYAQSFQNIEKLPINELNFSSGKVITLSVSKMISKYIEELVNKMNFNELHTGPHHHSITGNHDKHQHSH